MIIRNILLSAIAICMNAVATEITVDPANQTMALGNSTSVEVKINGLGSSTAPSVGTYDLTVSFDPSRISLSSVVWGSGLDVLGLGDIQSRIDGMGTIELFEVSLDSASDLNSLQPAAFTLFNLGFTALSPGTTPLNLSINALGDADGNSLSADVTNGSITIGTGTTSPVPEPNYSAMVGLACGVFAVHWICRRRARALTV